MSEALVIETGNGAVRGIREEGVRVFRGIPYGAATSGHQRFKAPQPCTPWEGELSAASYGNTCPQMSLIPAGAVGDQSPRSGAPKPPAAEDCLFLNVWTPDGPTTTARPVLVWLHGGGFTSGSGSELWNRGSRIAERGDVVVVSLNHRLGVLGFLELAELGGEEYADSGNVGMLDIIAALRWVRDEVAGFGGDPGNVTVFGYSGGGGKIATLLGMPAAAGLFHKAIIESGPMLHGLPLPEATANTLRFLEALSIDPSDITALQKLPVADLIKAAASVLPELMSRVFANAGGPRFGPVVDGRWLLSHPFDPVAAPSARGIPMIIGSNRDELAFLSVLVPGFEQKAPEEHLGIVRAFAGDRYDAVRDVYARTRPGASSSDLAIAAMTAPTRAATITLADRMASASSAPVYLYLFAYETDAEGGRLKAYHGAEVPYVFNLVDESPRTGTWKGRQGLADAICDAWIAFARTGSPDHPGLPSWPAYRSDTRATMVFDRQCEVAYDPHSEEREVWSGATIHMD